MMNTFLSNTWKNMRYSIKFKLSMLFLLGSLIPVILFSYFLFYNFPKIIKFKELTSVNHLIELSNNEMNNLISGAENKIIEVLTYPELLQSLQSKDMPPTLEWFYNQQIADDAISYAMGSSTYPYSITLIDNNGNTHNNNTLFTINETLNHNVAQTIINDRFDTSIFSRKLEDYNHSEVITMGRSIKHVNYLVGVIYVDIEKAAIEKLFQPLNTDVITVFAIDSHERVFFSLGDSLTSDEYLNNLTYVKNNSEDFIQIKNQEYLSFHITSPSSYDLTLLIPRDYIYADSNLFLKQTMLFALFVLFQITIYAIVFSQFFTKRIQILTQHVNQFSKHVEPIQLPTTSKDEVDQLINGFSDMSIQITNLIKKVKEDEQEKYTLELYALRSQFDPHMMYNTLNTITHLARLQGISNIEDVSESFSKLMHILTKSTDEFVTIEQEIKYIEHYISIKKYNLINNLNFQVSIKPELLHKPIIKLLLQPFVENSIIHGFVNMTKEASLHISIFKKNGYIHIQISDNGHGIPKNVLDELLIIPSSMKSEKKIGIKNTIRRFYLTYNNDCHYTIKSKTGLYTVIELAYPDLSEEDFDD